MFSALLLLWGDSGMVSLSLSLSVSLCICVYIFVGGFVYYNTVNSIIDNKLCSSNNMLARACSVMPCLPGCGSSLIRGGKWESIIEEAAISIHSDQIWK